MVEPTDVGIDVPALSSAAVVGSDGQRVGHVRDIYLTDAGNQLAAVSVELGRLAANTVLIPVAALEDEEPDEHGVVRLVVTAEAARGGMEHPDTLHARPADLRHATRALGLEEPAGA